MTTLSRRSDVDRTGGRDDQRDLGWLQQELSRYLGPFSDPASLLEGFTPPADIEETDEGYVVEIELPGVHKEDVSVEMSGRRLTVTGERRERERAGILRRKTRSVGRFRYEVVLPDNIDESGVEAELEHGVLSVRIPKATADRSRRIEVR